MDADPEKSPGRRPDRVARTITQIEMIGERAVLFIDRAVLELSGVHVGDVAEVTVIDEEMIVSPVRRARIELGLFDRALDRVMSRRSGVLRRLSK